LAFGLSVHGYTLKTFISDLISGLTVAFIRLPQGLAYGALAGVPPIHGLYTELFSCVLYSLFATSRLRSPLVSRDPFFQNTLGYIMRLD